MQIAVRPDRVRDSSLDRGRVDDVERDVLADAARLADELVGRHGAVVRLARPRSDDDGRSLGSEPHGDRATDAGRAARDEHDFPPESSLAHLENGDRGDLVEVALHPQRRHRDGCPGRARTRREDLGRDLHGLAPARGSWWNERTPRTLSSEPPKPSSTSRISVRMYRTSPPVSPGATMLWSTAQATWPANARTCRSPSRRRRVAGRSSTS